MVASYYLLKPLYSLMWRFLNLIKPRWDTVFYCHSAVDMQNWLPVQKYLKPIPIVSDKSQTRNALRNMGIKVTSLPVFPKAVIMCRVAAHKFPSRKVTKIGMTHGAYHFKRLTAAQNYNLFDLYLFTSEADLALAQNMGVSCGKVGGYPKLDPYLPVKAFSRELEAKACILFTATYDASGMSAVHLWMDRISELSDKYKVYVSLHPWMSKNIVQRILSLPNIHYVRDNPLPYLAEADVCIVDNSSIIGECCALNKSLISWKLPLAERSVPQISHLLEECSIRISTYEELVPAIEQALAHPGAQAYARQKANAIFFDSLDGLAGKRSAEHILKLLPELKL